MHSEMRGIGPTIVMLFWIWYELSGTEIAEIPQIYLNLTEISEDGQGSLFVMKTRWKRFKIVIIHNKANGIISDRDFYPHYLYCFNGV